MYVTIIIFAKSHKNFGYLFDKGAPCLIFTNVRYEPAGALATRAANFLLPGTEKRTRAGCTPRRPGELREDWVLVTSSERGIELL